MEQLRAYLNSLPTAEQEGYARRCGTSLGYLRKALIVSPRFDGALASALDRESGGVVPKESMRPDIFGTAPSKSVAKRIAAQNGGATKPKRKVT